MSSLVTALVVFAIVFGAACLGAAAQKLVPAHHLGDTSKDMVKTGAGFIATLAALVLGLLVASAKNSYDQKADELQQVGTKVILLDLTLRAFGREAATARAALLELVRARLDMKWVRAESTGLAGAHDKISSADGGLRASIAALQPSKDAQRRLQARALQLVDDAAQIRWLFVEESTARVSMPLLAVLVFWLATISACLGLYAPRNGTVAAVTLLCAWGGRFGGGG